MVATSLLPTDEMTGKASTESNISVNNSNRSWLLRDTGLRSVPEARLHFCPHFSIGFKSGDTDGHGNTSEPVSLSRYVGASASHPPCSTALVP